MSLHMGIYTHTCIIFKSIHTVRAHVQNVRVRICVFSTTSFDYRLFCLKEHMTTYSDILIVHGTRNNETQ